MLSHPLTVEPVDNATGVTGRVGTGWVVEDGCDGWSRVIMTHLHEGDASLWSHYRRCRMS